MDEKPSIKITEDDIMIKVQKLIEASIYEAAKGKVRQYALSDRAIDKMAPYLYATLTKIAQCKKNSDIIHYLDGDGNRVFASVDQYSIPVSMYLKDFLNFGRVFASSQSMKQRIEFGSKDADYTTTIKEYIPKTSEAEGRWVDTIVDTYVSPDEMLGYWGKIESTAPNGFTFGNVNKVDYLLGDLGCFRFGPEGADENEKAKLYAWSGVKVADCVVQGHYYVIGKGLDPTIFGARTLTSMTHDGITEVLSLDKDGGSESQRTNIEELRKGKVDSLLGDKPAIESPSLTETNLSNI